MQIDAAVLAYEIVVEDGRQTIKGLIASWHVPKVPITIEGFAYWVLMTFTPLECDRVHEFAVAIIDPDGELVGQSPAVPVEPVVDPFDAHGYASFEMVVDFVATGEGVYQIQLLVDGQRRHSTRLPVHLTPGAR